MEISALAAFSFGQTTSTNPQLLTVLSSRWQTQFQRTVQRADEDLSSQHSFPRRDFQFVIDIRVARREIGMRRMPHAQVQVARRRAAAAWLTLGGHANASAVR